MIRHSISCLVVGCCLWTSLAQAEETGASSTPTAAISSEVSNQPAASPAADHGALKDQPQQASPSYLRHPPTEPVAKQATQSQDPGLWRVMVALCLVLGLGVVAIVAKRRKSAPSSLRNQIRLHSLADLQLGPKSKVALVSVGREALLLGVTEQGIGCLRCYPEDELWSLTAALPGFNELIREQEEQEKLARRPKTERSLMDRGMDKAFSELLEKAAHGRPKVEPSEPAASKHERHEQSQPEEEFVPTQFRPRASHLASKSNSLDEFPPHLVALLKEALESPVVTQRAGKPKSGATVVRLPTSNQDAFSDLDGQAAELARRFAELSS